MRRPLPDEAWIALGSNLGDRRANIEAAVAALGGSVTLVSPLVETEPWGNTDQGPFLNGVARLRWGDGALALLRRCLAIEASLGRVRAERWGPRIIDLDVLLVGEERVHSEEIVVPHPGIASRSFVLDPWALVASDLVIPGLERTVGELKAAGCIPQ